MPTFVHAPVFNDKLAKLFLRNPDKQAEQKKECYHHSFWGDSLPHGGSITPCKASHTEGKHEKIYGKTLL